MTFLEQKSEKGEVCFDHTGAVGLHVRPSREAPFSVSSTISAGGLFRNGLLERVSQDFVQNGLKKGLPFRGQNVPKMTTIPKILKMGPRVSKMGARASKITENMPPGLQNEATGLQINPKS